MYKAPAEERTYERLNLPIKVNYEVSNRPQDTKDAISKNVGGGGICLSLQERLMPDAELNINIRIPKLKPKRYDIKGKVVWTRIIEITGEKNTSVYYDTGIQFLKTSPVIIGEIVTHFHGREI